MRSTAGGMATTFRQTAKLSWTHGKKKRERQPKHWHTARTILGHAMVLLELDPQLGLNTDCFVMCG